MVYSQIQEERSTNYVRLSILTILYFVYLYPILIPGLPFGTAMFALVLLAIYTASHSFGRVVLRENSTTTKMVRSYFYWNIFLLIYNFFLLQINGRGTGVSPAGDYIHMLIILPLFYISGNLIFRNLEELMKVLYIGLIIQTMVILVALFIPALTYWLISLFPPDAYNANEHFGGLIEAVTAGYKIGIGVYSSAGCLKLAIGQIGACYFVMKSKEEKLYVHLTIYLLSVIALSIVARTGLLISVAGLLSIYLAKRKMGINQSASFVFKLLLLMFLGYFITSNLLTTSFIDNTFQRLFNTMDNGVYDTYFRGYVGDTYADDANVIPPLCKETIIGLGITMGSSGSGYTTITDGGFMRNYSAMGLIVAVINYYIIFSYFFKKHKNSLCIENKYIILFLIFIIVIGEFKEYFIYYTTPICFMFLILNLIEKDEKIQFFDL